MNGSSRITRRAAGTIVTFLVVSALAIVAVPVTAAARPNASAVAPDLKTANGTNGLWGVVSKNGVVPSALASGHAVAVHAKHVGLYTLNAAGMRNALAKAPLEFTAAARTKPVVISLPSPDGTFQRFSVVYSPVMMPSLAKKHPKIRTYSGTGIDDPTATMRLAMTPLGLSSIVRGKGTWLTGTYFHLNQSLYGSYYSHDVINTQGDFQEKEVKKLEKQARTQNNAVQAAGVSPLVAVGSNLRIYRLALVTDPGYSNYWGGPGNVTAAKVMLMNRVNMIYENDFSYRLNLIANNDLLNLNTYDDAIGRNGPCGNAACFSLANISSCSSLAVIGTAIARIIPGGAGSYDIGHLALGAPGGGVAGLGVVGGASKAQGCTGIPQPDGDYYAIDYVAHEMGHQFSMNHTFNGNLFNCSGGNRNGGTSVEPGSGSSIMAYAGICQQDDLQPHSDPYFSQRSFDETQTYTSGAITNLNEVQQASFLHLGGGNEVQQATFGPGFQPTWTSRANTLTVVALSATIGGLSEVGNNVTVNTTAAHTMQVGDVFTLSGAGNAGYNCAGCVVTAIGPYSASFQYTNPTAGLPVSGGGTVTLASPGLTESGTDATFRTNTSLAALNVGDLITITGSSPAGYNCTSCPVTAISGNSFTYTAGTSGLANGSGATATKTSAFQIQIGGNDSVVIGGPGLPYNNANLTSAINAISGFSGTATATGAASTGFTVTYTGASAATDVPNFSFDNLQCGGCFSQVAETNHGGTSDSFTLSYGGGPDSATITNGVNYSTAGVAAAITPLLPVGGIVTIAALSNTGFTATFTGTLAGSASVLQLSVTNPSPGLSGWFGTSTKGGPSGRAGFQQVATGNTAPTVTPAPAATIPLRTPFTLTGSATDPDPNTLTYMWEQNNQGSAAVSLSNNTRTTGPLFRQFGTALDSNLYDPHANITTYCSNGENCTTTDPSRTFPDMAQILANNTNAATGSCPHGTPFNMPQLVVDCYSEFLPVTGYAATMSFRLTVRDGNAGAGGVNSANTTVTLAPGTGPFLVTSQSTPVAYDPASSQTVTWNVAGTSAPPISTANVKISLSTDGGATFPTVLAASTPNDGSEAVTLPNVGTTQARIKVEAVGNIYFDVNDSDFTIKIPQVINGFGPIANRSYGAPNFAITGVTGGGSGNPVTYTAGPGGVCTIVGSNTVHIVGGGVCTVTAHQAGNGSYGPAPDVAQSFQVNPKNTTVTLVKIVPSSVPSGQKTTFKAKVLAAPLSPAGLTVQFKAGATVIGTAVVNANKIAKAKLTVSLPPGSYTVKAEVVATANFSSSTSSGKSLTVT